VVVKPTTSPRFTSDESVDSNQRVSCCETTTNSVGFCSAMSRTTASVNFDAKVEAFLRDGGGRCPR
jgi:hypothetical protein